MSTKLGSSQTELNDCGCCEGIAVETPVEIANRPGLSAIAYRVGEHAQFRDTLVARLSAASYPALKYLTTRDADDFSLALLDAWATVADVLTFYQERIANESYLRTATERLSILELARLVGYELRPGVAASTYLAFTINDAPGITREQAAAFGMPERAVIDAGVKVQSIPGPDEKPQVFETVERIKARAEWNEIRPRLTRPQVLKANDTVIYFAGLANGLKKGDGLLITPDEGNASFRQIAEVETENDKQRTKVILQPHVADVGTHVPARTRNAVTLSPFAQQFVQTTTNQTELYALSLVHNFNILDLHDNLAALKQIQRTVLVMRVRAAIFGHNAPEWSALSLAQRNGERGGNPYGFYPGPYHDREFKWADNSLASYHGTSLNSRQVFLDNLYPTIVKHSWVVLKDDNTAKAYQVEQAAEVSKSDFTLSAKVTRLTLDSHNFFGVFGIRTTTVFAQSEELELARMPKHEPVAGVEIDLDTLVDGLFEGQSIIICGERAHVRGVNACEQATISKVEQVVETEDSYTRITLSAPLRYDYVRATATINANVALATHGETVTEVLGSGDASKTYQRFTLRQPPLTFVSADTPSGTRSTLEVRVNDILWHEVPTLYGHGPHERIYTTHTDDDGKTVVQFGDGQTGARVPSGQENVKATYRRGIGLPGLLKANQLSQLMTRPLGVKSATNPRATSGAAAPEARDDARRNATLTLHTLDRIVSLSDYEDFARAFAGVSKTLATWTWSGERRGVFVTVAGADGARIESDSPLYKNLLKAMRAAGDSSVPLQVQTYEPRFFVLKAKVQVRADYLPEKVLAETEARLRRAFSFDARSFGQPVTLSEVIAIMQATPGVVAVDVDQLYRSTGPTRIVQRLDILRLFQPFRLFQPLQTRLPAAAPFAGTDRVFAAELLTLDPRPLKLEVLP